MGNEQEFKIVVTGDATGWVGAATQSNEATQSLKNKTSELSDEMGVITVSGDQAAKILSQTGAKAQEAGEKVGVSKREIREMGNELGRAAGLGNIGKEMLGGVALGAFAAGAAIDFLKKTWEDIQAAIKGPIEITIHDDVAAITASAKAWTEYAEARKKVIDAANTPQAGADREIKELETKLKLLKDILKAEEDESLAALATNKDKMTPQAYEASVAAVKKSYSDFSTQQDEKNVQDQVNVKKAEAATLELDAANKKKQAEAIGTPDSARDADARGSLKKSAESATAALDEIDKNLEMINRIARRLKGEDVPEYQGVMGTGQAIQEQFVYDKQYGTDATPEDARRLEEQRKAQAESAIRSAAAVDAEDKRRSEKKAKLLTEAGTESGNAEELRKQAAQMQADADAQKVTNQGTSALASTASALGQQHAAENNNTPKGTQDAVAAQRAASTAALQVMAAIKANGDSNKELHMALENALADIVAEQKKLAKRIAAMPHTTK